MIQKDIEYGIVTAVLNYTAGMSHGRAIAREQDTNLGKR
jgi:hypothetical protein